MPTAVLTERSHAIGLASTDRLNWWMEKKKHIEDIIRYCDITNVKPKEVNTILDSIGTTPLQCGCKLRELIARPGVSILQIAEALPGLHALLDAPANRHQEIAETAEIQVKYQGYIEREKQAAEKMHRLENIRIQGHFKYDELNGLSTEARQKLTAINPELNIPCEADLLLPYIRLSSVLPFLQSLSCVRVFHLSLYTASFLTAIGMRYCHVPIAHRSKAWLSLSEQRGTDVLHRPIM